MPKYRVYGIFTATKFLGEFDADSEEAAEDMAADCDKNHASLCHQCTSDIELDDIMASRFFVEKEGD